jgi:uncharacterized protein
MTQTWNDVLLAHWPVPDEAVAGLLPPRLELDRFQGRAGVGVAAYVLGGLRLRGLPAMSKHSRFPEASLRTYVTCDGAPGVYLIALEAGRALAALGERPSFYLPYHDADLSFQRQGDFVTFSSSRVSRSDRADFSVAYRPTGPVYHPKEGSLERWMTDRRCFFTRDSDQKLWRTEIRHRPWRLQRANGAVIRNTLADAAGVELGDAAPVLHYTPRQDVLVMRLEEENAGQHQERPHRSRS